MISSWWFLHKTETVFNKEKTLFLSQVSHLFMIAYEYSFNDFKFVVLHEAEIVFNKEDSLF